MWKPKNALFILPQTISSTFSNCNVSLRLSESLLAYANKGNIGCGMAVTNVHSFGGTLLLDYCMLLWICPCVFILLNFNVFIMCRCCLRQQWIWEKDWLTLAPQILILCLWYSLTSNSHLVISSLCQDKRKTIAFVWCACLMNIATDAQGCLNFLYPVEQCSWLHGQCITCSQEQVLCTDRFGVGEVKWSRLLICVLYGWQLCTTKVVIYLQKLPLQLMLLLLLLQVLTYGTNRCVDSWKYEERM